MKPQSFKFLTISIVLFICFLGFLTPAQAQGEPSPQDSTAVQDSVPVVTVIVDSKYVDDIKEVRKSIKRLGGQVLIYLPPNVLRVKIRQDAISQLRNLDMVQDVSSDDIVSAPAGTYDAKTEEAVNLNNLISVEKKIQKNKARDEGQDLGPIMDDVRLDYEESLTPAEKDAKKKAYQQRWRKNGKALKKRLLELQGLEYRPEKEKQKKVLPSSLNQTSEDAAVAAAPGVENVEIAESAPGYYQTSLFMAGDIAVSMFFVSGSYGAWPSAQIDSVFASSIAALELYAEDNPDANITFVPIKEATSGVPHPLPGDDRTYANDIRQAYGTDWGYTIHAYYGDGRAYAYIFGPYHILYSADLRSGYVVRHETAHIFGARDQYHPDAGQSPTGIHGYLAAVNANSQYNDGTGYYGAGEGRPDIMISSTGNRILGPYTRGQIGWYDLDGDGILDVVDTLPQVSLDSVSYSTADHDLWFSGPAEDIPLPNSYPGYITGGQGSATINEIDRIEYRVNGLSWIPIKVTGESSYLILFSYRTNVPLPNGTYTFEARAVNSMGNTGQPAVEIITVNDPANPVTNAYPFAVFTASTEETSINSPISLDAGQSADMEDSVSQLQARWDINSDGTPETGWVPVTQIQSVQYATTGSKDITLEVRDSNSQVTTFVKTINVASGNLAPHAEFTVTPANKHGDAGQEFQVVVDASASFDPEDQDLMEVRWKFDDSLTWTNWMSFAAGKTQTYSYTMDPNYSKNWHISMEVRDTDDAVSSGSKFVWGVPYNHPPEPFSFTTSLENDTLTIGNMAIGDPDFGQAWDNYLYARFDTDGDGLWNTPFVDVGQPYYMENGGTLTYSVPAGTHAVTVTGQLRDRYYATSEYVQLVVADNVPPQITPISDKSATQGGSVHFGVTATDADGEAITLSATVGANQDPVSSVGASFVDNGDGTGTFDWPIGNQQQTGSYQFVFKATDINDTFSTENVTITVYRFGMPVTWVDLVGVIANGNTITKTAGETWGSGGAASAERIEGDGGVEFVINQTNTSRMCGLSDSNPDANYNTIDYAVYLYGNGALYVYENGSSRGTFGTYQSGDRFTVERIGSTVVYKKNESIFYTSSVASSGSLLVDAAIYSTGGEVAEARIVGVTPGPPAAVSDLSATAGDNEVTLTWSAPASNGSAITGYYVQYGEVDLGFGFPFTYNDDAVPGVTIGNLDNNVEYQFRVVATNGYGDSPVSNVATATPREIVTVDVAWMDLVGVTASGNTITKTAGTAWGNAGAASSQTFSGDGGLEFLATETNTYRMCGLSDSNLNANYTTIDYAVYLASGGAVYLYENGTSRGTFGTYQSGDRFSIERTGSTVVYKKNGTTFYTSTVASSGTLMADAAIHTTEGTISDAKISGVTLGAPNAVADLSASEGDGDVTLTWSAPSNNGSAISGYVVQYGTVASGLFENTYNDDAVPGATVGGLTNGTAYQFRVVATNGYGDSPVSNVATATPHVETSVNVTWVDLVGVTASGNTITKTASTGWGNAGAASSQTFSGDGGVEFLAEVTNTTGMCGLADSNPDANFSSIDYAIDLYNGLAYVFESGTSRGSFGSYQSGDRFSVERTGSTVVYKKNGTTFYTSTVASSGTLMADAAIHTTGGTVSDAKMSGVTLGAPNAVADLTASGGDGEVTLTWSAPSNNGSAISGYVVQYGMVVSGLFDNTYNDDAVPGATVSGLTNGTEYQFRVIATNGYGDSPESNVATATPHQITTVNVTWLNLVGVTANGNTITKTASTGWGNAGAASSQTFSGDGGLEFLATETNTYRMCGLSDSNPDANFTSIDYAVYLASGGAVYVYENGTSRGTFGTYQSGDRFSVERTGSTVVYKKNGTTFYTSTVASSGTLMADAAIHTTGGTVSDAKMSGVTLGAPNAVADLTASGGDGEVTLTWSAPSNNGSAISGYVVQYGTVVSGLFDNTYNDDAVPGATVSGLTNGTEYQFRVIATNGYGDSPESNVATATPQQITTVNVTWVNLVGVTANGNTITKTASTGWGNGGAASSQTFSGDGGLEFLAAATNTTGMCGLADSNPDANFSSIDYAIDLYNGLAYVFESGTSRGSFGSYQSGDRFSIERTGSTVVYKKNGTTFYTSAVASSGALMADAAIYTAGGAVSDAKMNGVTLGAPNAVSDLTASGGDGAITLTWSAPSNNGSAITGYVVQYGTVASGLFDNTYNDDAVPGATVSGLTNGTEYQFRVIATNGYGDSRESNVATATPQQITTIDVTWVNLVGVTASGNTITKTASTGWGNGGAVSSQTFSGDGRLEFLAVQVNTARMCGLSDSNPDANFTSIDYAVYLYSGTVYVFESGANRGTFGTYQSGDLFSIERTGSTVVYKKNGATFYTSTVVSSGALMADASIHTSGGKVENVQFVY